MRSGAGAALRSPTDEAARSRCAPLAEQIGARAMVPAIGVAAKAVTTLAMSGPSAEPQPDSARIRPTLIRRVTSKSEERPGRRLTAVRSPLTRPLSHQRWTTTVRTLRHTDHGQQGESFDRGVAADLLQRPRPRGPGVHRRGIPGPRVTANLSEGPNTMSSKPGREGCCVTPRSHRCPV